MGLLDSRTTPLAGLVAIDRTALEDHRGSFGRLFCDDSLAAWGWAGPVRQVNQSHTRCKGTVRGLRFQHPPAAEDKLVSCLVGSVFDVAVDLRWGSPTFLRWHGEILSGDNRCSLLIPKGFAHGFQTLSDDVTMIYVHSAAYDGAREDGIGPLDPRLAIDWPLPVADMSERDRAWPPLGPDFEGMAA